MSSIDCVEVRGSNTMSKGLKLDPVSVCFVLRIRKLRTGSLLKTTRPHEQCQALVRYEPFTQLAWDLQLRYNYTSTT